MNGPMGGFAAVVLAGGGGTRLGGVDKAQLAVSGETLLSLAMGALNQAAQIVVVGPEVTLEAQSNPARAPVTFAAEQPAGGGPAAGFLAGCDAITSDAEVVVVLAVDMPGVTSATIDRLISAQARTGGDGAFLHDSDGRRQLAGVLVRSRLEEIRPPRGSEAGLPIHRLLARLKLIEIAAIGDEGDDIDTAEDLARLRMTRGRGNLGT